MRTTCRPNYYRNPNEIFEAKAYLEAYRDFRIYGDYTYDNTTPANFFYCEDFRYKIDPRLTEKEIDALIALVLPKINKLFEITNEGSLSEGHLSDEARKLDFEIECVCDSYTTDEFEHCGDDMCEYCNTEEDIAEAKAEKQEA